MPNPYNFNFFEATKSYNFTTKNQTVYSVAFVVDETLSSISGLNIPNVYQFIIEKVSFEKEKLDINVGFTIKKIINQFFENTENAIIYFCDNSDNKALLRFKTFERWYKNSNMTHFISKVDNIINYNTDNQNYVLLTSLLFHINNSNKDSIVKIYKNIEEVLNSDKF